MNHIDFTLILSSALTPITLISGVGLLLLTMSARYDHTTARVRQLLHADEMTLFRSQEIPQYPEEIT